MSEHSTMNDFIVISRLGSGAFSEVYKVRRKSDNQEYALKKVKMQKLSEKEKENALNEVRILASIQNPNIIAFKDAFFEESSYSLCIVMEMADGGDLQSKINDLKKEGKFMEEEEIWSIFFHMVQGLQALHKVKIVHRDIKCANIFLTKEGMAKLGDLNVSKIAKMGILQTQTGTPYYASPEVWQDKPYDKKSDIWSLGCVLYELTTLNPPFTAKDMQGLYARVLKGVYPKIPSHFSSDLSAMIKALLQVQPQNRPTCKQILHMPVFIAKYNEGKMKHKPEMEKAEEEELALGEMNLLGTIRVPKNMRLLTERLPKSNFDSGKEKQQEEAKQDKLKKPKSTLKKQQLYDIQEENEIKIAKQATADTNNSHQSQQQQPQQPYTNPLSDGSAKKPPMQVHRHPRVKSDRFGPVARGHSESNGCVNSLVQKQDKILNKHRHSESRDIPQSYRQDFQTVDQNKKPQINQVLPQPESQQENPGRLKQQRSRTKMYINEIPKTSPNSRNGIEDIYYQIAHGKGALIEKRELRQIQNEQQQQAVRKDQMQEQQQPPQIHKIQNQPSIPKQSKQSVQVEDMKQEALLKKRPRESQKGLRYQRAQIDQEDSFDRLMNQQNSKNNQAQVNAPMLPQIQSTRNSNSHQITPKYQLRTREVISTRNQQLQNVYNSKAQVNYSQIQSLNQSSTYAQSIQKEVSSSRGQLQAALLYPNMGQRSRSKDSMPIQNNLRDVYKQMTGAQKVVEGGRLESQRLLGDHYRRIQQDSYGYMNPINLKRPQQQYIPMSQHGHRNLLNYASPQSREYARQQVPVVQQNKPDWW